MTSKQFKLVKEFSFSFSVNTTRYDIIIESLTAVLENLKQMIRVTAVFSTFTGDPGAWMAFHYPDPKLLPDYFIKSKKGNNLGVNILSQIAKFRK